MTKRTNEAAELYVGYAPAPARHARFLRVFVPLLLWSMVVVSGVSVWAMRDPGPAVWLTDTKQSWTGRVETSPYPMLHVQEEGAGGVGGVGGAARTLLVVELFKQGAQERLAALDGQTATLTGYHLERGGVEMIELDPQESGVVGVVAPAGAAGVSIVGTAPDGERTFVGEILDGKCYLGAMKPGDGKAHKACATLCVSGGVPPLFVVREGPEKGRVFVLAEEGAETLTSSLLNLIAEPVSLTGVASRRGGVDVLTVARR